MVSIVKNGAFSDISFVKIEWLKGKSPNDNDNLARIIEEVDEQFFGTGVTEGIEECLKHSYFPFSHAEILFANIKEVFGDFVLKRVSLANNEEGLRKNTFIPSTEDEVSISNLKLDDSYTNLIDVFIKEGFYGDCGRQFAQQGYSYNDVLNYFREVLSAYQKSRDLKSTEMNRFQLPSAEEVESVFGNKKSKSDMSNDTDRLNNMNNQYFKDKLKQLNLKIIVLTIVSVLSLIVSVVFFVINSSSISNNYRSLQTINTKVSQSEKLLSEQHSADVFGRYFMSYYYSGNKDNLSEFLASNDAKYTQPDTATVNTALLENITLKDSSKNTYELTYVVTTTKSPYIHKTC